MTADSNDVRLVPVVVGPVSTASARVWIASATATVATVRANPALHVPEDVLAHFDAYLDQWRTQLDGPEFLWTGEVDPDVLRSIAAHWANLVTLSREDPEGTGLSVAPPEGEAFFVALATGMGEALERIDDADDFAGKFEEVVPEFSSGPRRPDIPGSELRRVLLVDDSADIRLLLRIGLETSGGFRIVGEAGNGQEAIDAVAGGCPDAILLDVSMPVMDGLTALPLLKERCSETRVVVFSADDTPAVRRQVTEGGGFRFLRKDAPINEIAEVLLSP